MALVNLREILADARENHYAIGAFNVVSLDSLQAILEAAVAEKAPVILNVAEVHFKYIDLEGIAPALQRAAAQAPVPVALHLDHGESLPALMRAIRTGFTSVMFDGSALPYEENVAKTQEIVKMAHAVGVTVEAELGHVGGSEGGTGGPAEADPSLFTEPELARDFVARTGVDALAIAIGSVHGVYRAKPKLDFIRLAKIRDLTGIPLVLHGGSGIPDHDFREAIRLGIAKINVYTEISQAASQAIRELLAEKPGVSFPEMLLAARAAMKECVREKMRVFGSSNACLSPRVFCLACGACSLGDTTAGRRLAAGAAAQEAAAASGSQIRRESGLSLDEKELAALVARVTRQVMASLNHKGGRKAPF